MSAIGAILDFVEAAVAAIDVSPPFRLHQLEGNLEDQPIDDNFHRLFDVTFNLDPSLTGAHGADNAEADATFVVRTGYVGQLTDRALLRTIYDDHELMWTKLVAKIDPGYPDELELVLPLPASPTQLAGGEADGIIVTAPFRFRYWATATA